jgi:hypothetical protein
MHLVKSNFTPSKVMGFDYQCFIVLLFLIFLYSPISYIKNKRDTDDFDTPSVQLI